MNTLTKSDQPKGEVSTVRARRSITPVVNITETKEGYYLEAEMPGVNKDGLEVTLEGNELTILGHRQSHEPEGAQALYRESLNRDYRRVFVLDPQVDTSKINAKMDQGVLKLTLPKAASAKPRKIEVTG
jgi:HSP20 family protein